MRRILASNHNLWACFGWFSFVCAVFVIDPWFKLILLTAARVLPLTHHFRGY